MLVRRDRYSVWAAQPRPVPVNRVHRTAQDVVAADKARDKGGGRPIEHLAWRIGLLDTAVIHDDDEIGQCQGFVLAVGDMDKGDPKLALETH